MAERQPNILFIQVDQLTTSALPFHGHPLVRTPNLSRLAERAVVFDAAYCNSPLCAPSRFSMLAGQLVSSIEAYDNATEFPAAVPTFAHHLRLAGYRTRLVGKMHYVGPDQLHGFEERLTTDIYPADFGWTPDWTRPGELQDYFHVMASITNAGPYARTLQLDYDEEVAAHASQALYDLIRAPDDRPFFLLASFTHPHDPYATDKAHWDLYEGLEIDLPRVPSIPIEQQDPHSARLMRCYRADEAALDEETVRRARRAYYGSISYIDDKVGALLGVLEASGRADDTIVVFTGDHGDMLGERGLWYKMSFFEGSARVPMLVHAPGRFGAARVGRPVSLLDLFPTLLDFAGPTAPQPIEPLPGRSLLPLLEGATGGGPTEVLGEYLAEAAAGPLVMIRRDDLKYIVGEDSPPQLFDLANDPDELTNLADDPTRAETAAAFAREVAERWDFAALRAAVIRNQQRRLLVQQANLTGRVTPWDHQPAPDASRRYMRNTGSMLKDLERLSNLPLA